LLVRSVLETLSACNLSVFTIFCQWEARAYRANIWRGTIWGWTTLLFFTRSPTLSYFQRSSHCFYSEKKKKKSYLFIGHGIWNPNPFPSVIQVAIIRLGTLWEQISKITLEKHTLEKHNLKKKVNKNIIINFIFLLEPLICKNAKLSFLNLQSWKASMVLTSLVLFVTTNFIGWSLLLFFKPLGIFF
jgi:hypothetical protein